MTLLKTRIKHRAIVELRGDRNMCPSCGEHFNSGFAFDKHRVGEYGRYEQGRLLPSERKCLTASEMRAIGMAVNSGGWWISAVNQQQWGNNNDK